MGRRAASRDRLARQMLFSGRGLAEFDDGRLAQFLEQPVEILETARRLRTLARHQDDNERARLFSSPLTGNLLHLGAIETVGTGRN